LLIIVVIEEKKRIVVVIEEKKRIVVTEEKKALYIAYNFTNFTSISHKYILLKKEKGNKLRRKNESYIYTRVLFKKKGAKEAHFKKF